MSRQIEQIERPVHDVFCGHKFSATQKELLIELTLNQFRKSVHKRLKPLDLVQLVKIKFNFKKK